MLTLTINIDDKNFIIGFMKSYFVDCIIDAYKNCKILALDNIKTEVQDNYKFNLDDIFKRDVLLPLVKISSSGKRHNLTIEGEVEVDNVKVTVDKLLAFIEYGTTKILGVHIFTKAIQKIKREYKEIYNVYMKGGIK